MADAVVLEDRGKALTEEALGLVAGSGVEASAAVVDARPSDGLLALAEQHRARMLVVGTHGERAPDGRGARLDRLQAPAPLPVPVLVVRPADQG